MDLAWKIAVGGVAAAILASTLRSYNREMALATALAACAVLAAAGIGMLRDVRIRMDELSLAAGISGELLSPLLRVCAVELATRIAKTFCGQAGEETLGNVVELCGGLAALCASLPLLDAVLAVARELLGG